MKNKKFFYSLLWLINIVILPLQAEQICDIDSFKKSIPQEATAFSNESKKHFTLNIKDQDAYWMFTVNKHSLRKKSLLLNQTKQLKSLKEKKLKILNRFRKTLESDMFYKAEKVMDYPFVAFENKGLIHIVKGVVGESKKSVSGESTDDMYAAWVVESKNQFYLGYVYVFPVEKKFPSYEIIRSRLGNFLKLCQIKEGDN